MADTIRRINIYINTQEGQAQLAKLTEKQDKLVKQIAKTTQGTQEWTDKHKELAKVRDAISVVNKQLSGELGPTLKQLTAEQNKLNRAIADMPLEARKASAEYARLMQINEVKAQMKVDERPKASFIDNFKNQAMAGAAGVVGGNLATMAIEGVANYFINGIQSAAKLSDQISDIKRTTGQTTEEVEALNKELSKIDTRTPTSDLREMAIVAGQFGVAKDQIKGFVENLDKVNIVMGSEFGGNAEAVATEMSKLRNIFTDIKSDNIGTDIGFISNAMNKLAQDGVATAPVIADLSNRIGGYGIQIGLTTGQTLGLSATLQELNVSAERGGTAVTKILQKMLTNVSDFAKIAGVPVDQFKVMLNEDLFGAFTKVMEGSKKLGSSSTLLANLIKDLEVQGAGASEVFAKLGANTDMLKAKVNTANIALTNQNSINEQAKEKQENLAGSIAQLGKEWDKMMNNPSMRSFFAVIVDGGSQAIKLIKGLGEGLHIVWDILSTPVTMFTNDDTPWQKFKARQQAQIDELNKEVEAKNQEATRVRIAGAINGYKQLNEAELQHQVDKLKIIHDGNIKYAKDLMNQGKIAEAQLHLNASLEEKAIYEGALKALNIKKKANNEETRLKQEAEAKKLAAEQETNKKAQAEAKQFAAKKLADFKKLQEEISALEDEAARAKLPKNEAEILAIEQKYAKLYARAKGHVIEIAKLVQLEYQEKVTVYDKQIKAATEAYEKETDEFRKKELAKTAKMHEENKKQLAIIYDTEQAKNNILLTNARTEEEKYNAQKENLLLRTQELTDNDQLSAEQRKLIWEQYYADLQQLDDNHFQYQINTVMAFANAALDVFSSIGQLENAQANARLQMQTNQANLQIKSEERVKTEALNQLEQRKKLGLISEQNYATAREQIEANYSTNVAKINDDLEAKKRIAARETAERERDAAIFSTIVNTAAAIIKMLADPGGLAGIGLSIAAGITGAVQLATIMTTPLPELATGGRTEKVMGQSGKTYNATKIGTFAGGGIYRNASYGIIGENGTELVIPNWLYSNPQMVDTMKFLEYAIANGTVPMQQFANGGPTSKSQNQSNVSSSESQMLSIQTQQLILLISKNNELLLDLRNTLSSGIYAKIVYDQFKKDVDFAVFDVNGNEQIAKKINDPIIEIFNQGKFLSIR
jgi:TP901 family phage tail tape measure protein